MKPPPITIELLRLAIGPPVNVAALRVVHDRLHRVIQNRAGRVARRWAPSIAESKQELEDLIQIVLEHLFVPDFRVLRTWDPTLPGAASAENYFGLIAERKVNEVLRGAKNPWKNVALDLAIFVDLPSGEPSSEAEYRARELAELIREELKERASAQGYRMFELLWRQCLDVDQICKLQNLSRSGVDQWVKRLKEIIAQILRELE